MIKKQIFNKEVFLLVIIYAVFFMARAAYPAILFHDNFDSQPDWRTIGTSSSKDIDGYSGSGAQAGCPTGWDFWRVDEAWTPENTTGAKPSVQITATNRLGTSGKSLVITTESHKGSAGDGWGSDGFLSKYLGASGHQEIFLRYKIKTQPGFKRHWDAIMQSAMKTSRILRYEGPGSVFTFFSGGYTVPGAIEDMCESNYGGFTNMASRCDPQETNYDCGQYGTVSRFKVPGTCANVTGWLYQDQTVGTDDSAVGIFDAGEHTVIMHVRMNSAPGVADGVYEYYYDGCLASSRSDIPWVATGGSVVQGWNSIGLGGNARNNHAGITNWPPTYQAGAEQWYAFDDVVIATTLQEAIDGPTGICELFYQAPTGDGLSGVGNGESRNAYRGMYWTGESITTCSGSVRLSPVGNIDNIDYEVAVWSVDVADNLSLDTKLASVTISGADIVDGWNDFTLSTPVLMSSGNTVIVISRTDPSTLDGSNYIRVYNGYDETDTESRQWNIHYEPDGTMAGRSPGDEDQPEYFTCDWRLNSYLTTSSSSRPNIPEDIDVAVNSGTSILVSWFNRDDSGVVIDHYNVYTYNLATAAKTKVGESETTSFVHSNLQTGVYTYVVTAVSSTGAESYHSLDNADAWTISFTAVPPPNVLFETNFDSDDDWSPTQPMLSSIDSGTIGSPTSGPEGFSYWWMDRTYFTAPGNNTLNITSANAISGKSLVYWNESNGGGSLWGSDALLIKVLDQPQSELYVMFDAKFSPTWQWASGDTTQQKFFRISHWDGDLPIVAQQDNNRPQCIWDMSSYSGGNINSLSAIRYEVDYFATARGGDELNTLSTRANWATGIGDGTRHRFKYHIKANSAVGVADGVWEVWVDEVLVASYSDVAWNDTGGSADPRHYFNTVQLGGNNFNRYSDVSNEDEQYHAYDNLVISTTDIPWDYVIGGAAPPSGNVIYTGSMSGGVYR